MKKKLFIVFSLLLALILVGCSKIGNIGKGESKEIYEESKTNSSTYQEWLESIKGADGREVELNIFNGYFSWRYVGDTMWIPLFSVEGISGTPGTNGEDGREVELRVFNGVIQWHYANEPAWTDLLDLSEASGEKGADGIGIEKIELANTEGLVDTYNIIFTDGTSTRFTVTNGKGDKGDKGDPGEQGEQGEKGEKGDRGNGIESVELKEAFDTYCIYTITYDDGTTSEFTIKTVKGDTGDQGDQGEQGIQGDQGNGIESIELTDSPNDYTDIYTIYFTDGSSFDFEVRHGMPLNERQYKVTFDSNGGSDVTPQYIKFGHKATTPEEPTKDGYKFAGWYFGTEKWSFAGYFITENTTLVAHWDVAEYTITYDLKGGENAEDNPTTFTIFTDGLELLAPTKVGYTFAGWYADTNYNVSVPYINEGTFGNLTVHAKWIANVHTITFVANGGAKIDPIQVEYGTTMDLPITDRAGYAFVHWCTDSTLQEQCKLLTMPDEDLTLYARWLVDGNATYKVYVYLQNLDGSYSLSPSKILTYDDAPEKTVSAPTTYFSGYNTPSNIPSGLVVSDGSLILKLYYTLATYQIGVYSDTMGWTYYNFKYGEEVSIPQPKKTGYIFVGYDIEVPETMPSYTVFLYPQWQANVFNITFDTNGGDLDTDTAEYMYNQSVILPVPTAEGYVFAGWYYEGKKISDGNWTIQKDITLTAHWATKIDDFVFDQVDDYLVLADYTGSDTEITIPDNVSGNLVLKIADDAFKDNTTIEKVYIMNGIAEIGANAFAGCTALKEIVFPSSVTEYSSGILTGSTAVEIIELPANFSKQIKYLFGNNISNVPSTLTKIRYAAGCTSINKTMWNSGKIKNDGDPITLELASDWTYVPSQAFYDCDYLEKVIINEGCSYTGSNAFQYCDNLKEVVLPSTLVYLYNYSFAQCYALTDINFPSSLVSIYDNAFYNCTSLKSVNLNEGLQQINYFSFGNCSALEEVNIPSSVTYIGTYAFRNCDKLATIVIPKSVTSMDSYVFEYSNVNVFIEADEMPSNWSSGWINNLRGTAIWGYVDTAEVDGIIYALTSNEVAYVIGVTNKEATKYVFASEIDGYTVESANLYNLFYQNKYVEEVYIPASFNMSIPSNAFYQCTNLKKVVFEEDSQISEIGSYAFYQCSSLEEITIPGSVTKINNDAFNQCTNLKKVVFEEDSQISEIGSNAFNQCTSLEEIIIPGSVTKINSSAFYQCSNLKKVTLEEGIEYIYQYAFQSCNALTNVYLPRSLQYIEYGAFYNCNKLKTAYVPSSITNMNNAFGECYSLVVYTDATEKVDTWSDNWNNYRTTVWGVSDILTSDIYTYYVNEDGNAVITAIDAENDSEVFVPATIDDYAVASINSSIAYDQKLRIYCAAPQPEGWSYSGASGAFYWSVAGKAENDEYTYLYDNDGNAKIIAVASQPSGDVVIPDEVDGYIVIGLGDSLFSNNTEISSVVLPDTIKSIGDKIFYNCTYLESINLPNGLETIGSYAFYQCTYVSISAMPSSITSVGSYAFYDCDNVKTANFSDALTSLGEYAFYDCDKLFEVSFGNSLTLIPRYAFYSCGLLTSVEVPGSVKTIMEYAFYQCVKIKTLVLNEGVEKIESSVFQEDYALISVSLPNTLQYIGSNAFNNCTALSNVFIPESVTNINDYPFMHCDKLTIYCSVSEKPANWYSNWNQKDWNSHYYDVVWGVEFFGETNDFTYVVNEKGEATILAMKDSKITSYEFEDNIGDYTITEIGSKAFYQFAKLTTVKLPAGLKRIGQYAFYQCSSLTTIDIPENVTLINDYAFYNCSKLASVTGGENVKNIGQYAFYNCNTLESIDEMNNVTSIGNDAFRDCRNLKSLFDVSKVKSIGDYAFCYCYYLAIDWNLESIESIGCNAFEWIGNNQSNMFSITLGENLFSLSNYAITTIDKLEFLYFSNSHSILYENAVYNCFYSTIICEAESESALWDTKWNSSNIPVIWNCKGLYENDEVKYVLDANDNAYIIKWKDDDVESVDLSQVDGYDVLSICSKAFYGKENLVNVTFGDNIKFIGDYAFSNCRSLSFVSFNEKMKSIGNNAFRGCSILKVLALPEGLETIGDYAFCDISLGSMYLPSTLTYVGYGAFCNSDNVNVCVPSSDFDSSAWNYSWDFGFSANYIYNATEWQIDNNYIYYVIDGKGYVVQYIDYEAKSVVLDKINDVVPVSFILRYAFNNLSNLQRVVVTENVEDIAYYSFYNCNNTYVCCCMDRLPTNEYIGNTLGTYYNFDITHEVKQITLKSPDVTKAYDGSTVNISIEDIIVDGELNSGDYASLRSSNSPWEIGSWERFFTVYIYDENSNNVSMYYDITYEYGTVTISE